MTFSHKSQMENEVNSHALDSVDELQFDSFRLMLFLLGF